MKILVDNGHGVDTPGKCSPDGRLREYKYCREIASVVVSKLRAEGYDAEVLVSEERDIPLSERVARVNRWCSSLGARNICLVSIHLNAAGSGTDWKQARGWEAWTSPGQTSGDRFSESLYEAAEAYLPFGTRIRMDMSDGDRDKEASFTILTRTKCAACLTENLFQDNREDVAWLLSEEGKATIVKIHVEGIKRYVG